MNARVLILPDDKCYLLLSTGASEAECFSAMEKCIRAVRAWMIQDKMKLNDDKTEFLIIGTSQQLKKVHTDTLSESEM